jgi:hypothetical protein
MAESKFKIGDNVKLFMDDLCYTVTKVNSRTIKIKNPETQENNELFSTFYDIRCDCINRDGVNENLLYISE